MTGKAVALVALAAVGCGREKEFSPDSSKLVAALPGTSLADSIVRARYGVSAAPAPEIYWYGGAGLDCLNGGGWKEPLAVTPDNPDGCIGGREDDGVVLLAAAAGHPIHELRLAHEEAHYASELLGQGGDYDHIGPFFAPGGPMDQANADLAAAGL